MKQFETEHYVFHFREGTAAEADIAKIAQYQERCFHHICGVLNVLPEWKIEYFLCDSPEEVGENYGDGEACNGFARLPNKIYAVYSERVQCVGFHEDAHLLSFLINRPDCPAIKEGLAMYFDRKWWGIGNLDWAGHFLKNGQYLPVEKLLDREYFFDQDCTVTYPIMGAFTDWLISTYGLERYLQMFRQQNMAEAMVQVYGKMPEALNAAFVEYVGLFQTDEVLQQRMAELLRG